MTRLLTRALALSLCLYAAAPASADGVNARTRASVQRKSRRAARKGSTRGADAAAARAKGEATKAEAEATGPLPSVAELDLEGLKKLLARGDDPAKARPLLVNFWATWCDPCREEFPDLVKINDAYKDRGLDFAVVSGDDISEIKTGVPKFLRRMHATMPPYLLNVDDMGAAIALIDPAWGGELPATYLYDRSGHIAFKHFGRVDPTELRAALDKVLAAN